MILPKESAQLHEKNRKSRMLQPLLSQGRTWVAMQYLLTGESVPVNNVFTAKALLDSSLHYMQQLGSLKSAGTG
jgi:enoyl-[acyl-carrier-protein] reductase (NADH)